MIIIIMKINISTSVVAAVKWSIPVVQGSCFIPTVRYVHTLKDVFHYLVVAHI